MSRFTMEDLERLSVGQGMGIDTSPYQNGNDTYQYPSLTNPSIRARIYDVLVRADGSALPRSEIAKRLGLKQTPWLIMAIESLVNDGYLNKYRTVYKNGALMFAYEVKR